MPQTKKSTAADLAKKVGGGIAVLLFWIAVWQAAAMLVGREVVLPAPFAVFKRFFALAGTLAFLRATLHTLFRITIGYLAGAVGGILIGFLTYFSRAADKTLSPLLTVVRATPAASFILLALVMLKNAAIPTFITFLMVLPIISGCVRTALAGTDRSLIEMTTVYRFSFFKKLRTLYLPTVAAPLFDRLPDALGFAWKAGVAAEVLCTPADSIGKFLYQSKIYLETTDLFAYTLWIICLSLLLEKILHRLFGKKKEARA